MLERPTSIGHDTWVLEDAPGEEVASIRERKLTVRDSIKIDLGGREAKVKNAMLWDP